MLSVINNFYSRELGVQFIMESESHRAPRVHQAVKLERINKDHQSFSLIGRLESKKETNRNALMSMIKKGWPISDEVEILEMARNVFIFQFSDQRDYFKILKGRPWAFQSNLLNLQQWEEDMIYQEVQFDLCPIWVQFHGLPFCFLYKENAVKLGSMVGRVVAVEDPRNEDKLISKFLRARVLLNINQPLVTGFWVPREKKDDVWVEARFERLPSLCYRCGIFGHEQRSCSEPELSETEELPFGSWLKISPPRSGEENIVWIDRGWCEWSETSETAARVPQSRGPRMPASAVRIEPDRKSVV